MSATAAVRAAVSVAARHGLRSDDPVVLRDTTNVLVHLRPYPVVARVATTLGAWRGRRPLELELSFAAAAAAAGAPVVPPAEELPPGPHTAGGLLVSFWRHVSHRASAGADGAAIGRSLRELHARLEGLEVVLPRHDRVAEVRALLAELEPDRLVSRGDLDGLQAAADAVAARPVRAPEQPLHGDAHIGNVLVTDRGLVWCDLENVCTGPVEYDLACLEFRRRVHGRGPQAAVDALAAYGTYDAGVLEQMLPVLGLFLAVATIPIVRRHERPELVAFLRERLEFAQAIV